MDEVNMTTKLSELTALKGGAHLHETMLRLYDDVQLKAKIGNYLKAKSATHEDVEDIFQDGIINLILNIRKGTYDGSGNVESYLFGICKNLWYKKFNSSIKLRKTEKDWGISSQESSLEILLAKEKRMLEVKSMMNEMGGVCRKILQLWKLNYNMMEIARRMDYKSAGMARKKKHVCLKRLIDLMKNKENKF